MKGRKKLFLRLKEDLKKRQGDLVWIHVASLGEFEQAKPLIERIKANDPGIDVLVTFFSPSGYETGKDYPSIDYAHYLPLDTKSNARKFVEIVRPQVAVFIKYEYWYYYIMALYEAKVPLVVASGTFRKDQLYFHPTGRFFLRAFRTINMFFLQDAFSGNILKRAGLNNYKIVGDTRFDRVINIAMSAENYPLVEEFKNEEKLMVFGSVWPSDLDRLKKFIEERSEKMKLIIAPHNLDNDILSNLERLSGSVRYSKGEEANLIKARVLILDTMGMLSKIYRYGEFAFVGGGFRGGLHNLLEPAVYGIPVFFGEHTNNQKFVEAQELLVCGGAFSFYAHQELKVKFDELWENEESYKKAGNASRQYIYSRQGTTQRIVSKIMELL